MCNLNEGEIDKIYVGMTPKSLIVKGTIRKSYLLSSVRLRSPLAGRANNPHNLTSALAPFFQNNTKSTDLYYQTEVPSKRGVFGRWGETR